ncbi:hypothetical protein F5Y15DRAFT_415096 [Xylariaceae sp. FL0016]|nr:hypothetical protein F5Y15DRAFT_415096 [Xylariaceae sp. FL0016]
MDDFSDDDLDTLNANALQELENNAIQFTQHQPKLEPTEHDFDYDFEDDDLDDTVVQDALQTKTTIPSADHPAALPTRVVPQQDAWGPVPIPASHFRPQPIATVARPLANNAANLRISQNIPPHSQAQPYSQHPRQPSALPRPAPSISSRYPPSQAPRQSAPSAHEFAALEAQILDLKSRLNTKDGEISIVRKRLEKSRENYDRELQAVKKQTAEQLAKHERAVQAAKAAQQSAATELEFTRRDLREEVDRAKRKEGPGTPKKNKAAKSWGIADGFEDVEMAGSPSRRNKNAGPVASSVVEPPRLLRTPTKAKRKRPNIESPIMALETSEDVVMPDAVEAVKKSPKDLHPASSKPSLDYLKVILNHSAAHGRPLVFENLAAFALPSSPSESLASILLHRIAVAGDPDDPMRLPIEFCEKVIQLWDGCRKEKCLVPIADLVSLVSFTMQLHTVALAPYLAPSLLPVAMDSCYEVAIPRFNHRGLGDPTDEAFKEFQKNIPMSDIMSLLYLTAAGCATSEPVGNGLTSPAMDFWSSVHPQFVLHLLSQKQPIEDFLATLRLLCTSVLPDSVGPINANHTPPAMARFLIDRLSMHLTDTLRWEVDEIRLRQVRNAVLQTLVSFTRSPFGLVQCAQHERLIPRLVTLLNWCIDELYDGDMHYTSPDENTLIGQLHLLVANTMLVLHLLVTDARTASVADVAAKLAKSTGGSQKYLLSLARLNFGEDLVSEETAELAHDLLELAVTSEDGVEIGEFFGA